MNIQNNEYKLETLRIPATGARTMPASAPLAVVMPVFNERRTISPIISRVLEQTCVSQVIAVDDASVDDSWQELKQWPSRDARVTVLQHRRNLGKGAAIRTGLEQVNAPVVIIQDADLEYEPSDYESMLALILRDEADVVYGSRFLKAQSVRNARWHTFGNVVLTFISNLASGLALSDEATCYKMFRTKILSQIELEENRFGFCPEVTAKVAQLGVRILEVPISYRGRSRSEGKKIRLRDGIDALRCIITYNFFRRKRSARGA
jgi:glycosyltransferase involved in cell wall biosynthesis